MESYSSDESDTEFVLDGESECSLCESKREDDSDFVTLTTLSSLLEEKFNFWYQ